MKINILQPKRALFVALVILLSMAGMTKVMAQVPNLTKVSEFNIQSLRTIEERVSLLHYIQQSEVFSYVYNDAEGKFDIFVPQDYTCDEANESPDFDMFLENWQEEWTAYSNLDKQERGRLYVEWRYQLDDNTFRAANEDFYEFWRNNRDGNGTCDGAEPFCTDNGIYDFPASTNVPNMGSNDPYYCNGVEHQGQDNCLYTSPNPAFYYMRIANPGDLDIYIHTEPAHDVDFDCWGPFNDPEAACNQLSCSNMVDCSYSAASNEHCHIYNAQSGQYYLLLITNYSNQECNILFENTTVNSGTTDCTLLPPIVDNDGPYCVGETIHLNATSISGDSYRWTGPNNFTSRYQNVSRTNCTMDMAGTYTCTITKNGQTASATTEVVIVDDVLYTDYSATACDSYTWHGTEYTSSGNYSYTTETAQGCQHTETLHLTIIEGETEELVASAYDSYTWHGQTYTESGTYTFDTITAQGCQRVEVLHLTIGNHWTPVDDGQYAYSMTFWGVIQIDGEEQYSDRLELGVFCGDECRGIAMAQEFFLTHRYLVEVNVYGDSGEQLTFRLFDHRIQRELEQIPQEVLTFTIDGYGTPIDPYVLNFISYKEITATTAPEGAGTVTGTGEYTMGSTCTLTATANTGFQFQNWTLNGTVVSTSPNYTFTVTGAANYVAHFQYVQSRTLVSGWNWWSTYIEQNGSNGLEMLENSLGTSGIRIQGKNNSVDYFEYQGTGYWYGSLNTLTNEQMYMIRTSAACDAVIVGDAALPSNHPITINGGWNWIGYPYSQSVSVDAAMAGFMPEPNDVIKGRSSASMYLSYGGYQGWYGQLNTLEPGQGYMYRSYSDATKTLTFQTGRGGETLANITPESNVFVPNTDNYADNMIVTAVIDMEGAELRSEDYELAAFAGNECRGSVKLMYVEPYDRYVALLMAYGEGGEELRFVLTDGEGTSWSNDKMMYTANGMVGTMTEPTVLHFGPMGTEDNLQKPIHVYPNPSNGIFNIEGEGIQKIEVIDIYGQVILSKEVKNANHKVDLSDKAAGAYLLRVVTVDGIVTHKLIKDN